MVDRRAYAVFPVLARPFAASCTETDWLISGEQYPPSGELDALGDLC